MEVDAVPANLDIENEFIADAARRRQSAEIGCPLS
jgi:hypothetical protein